MGEETQPRFSTRTVLVIGSIATVVSFVAWIVTASMGSGLWLLFVLTLLAGIVVLVTGLVRESREKRAKASSSR